MEINKPIERGAMEQPCHSDPLTRLGAGSGRNLSLGIALLRFLIPWSLPCQGLHSG